MYCHFNINLFFFFLEILSSRYLTFSWRRGGALFFFFLFFRGSPDRKLKKKKIRVKIFLY